MAVPFLLLYFMNKLFENILCNNIMSSVCLHGGKFRGTYWRDEEVHIMGTLGFFRVLYNTLITIFVKFFSVCKISVENFIFHRLLNWYIWRGWKIEVTSWEKQYNIRRKNLKIFWLKKYWCKKVKWKFWNGILEKE